MQSSVLLLLCCTAYAAATPLMLLSYDVAESGDRAGRSAFTRCRHPMPFYDAVTKKLSYRCPTAPLKVQYEAVQDPQGNLEIIETLVEPVFAADPVVKVGHISELEEQGLRSGFGPAYATRAKKPCPEGQVFIAELGICHTIPSNNKPKNKPRTHKPTRVTSPLMSDDSDETLAEIVEPIIIRVVKGPKNKCKDNEVFNSELGICLPINNCWPKTACNEDD